MAGIGSVQSVNGMFTITDASGKTQQVDLGVLMMMINIDRVNNLDSQIAVQLAEIQERNEALKEMTELLSTIRNLKATGGACESGKLVYASDGKSYTLVDTKIKEIAEKYGIELTYHVSGGTRPSKSGDSQTKWDNIYETNINNIKSKIELMNNDSQMANIKLQNLLEKRNNAFEMTTKVMDTNNQSIQSILRNL